MHSRRRTAYIVGMGLASLAAPAWGGVVTSTWKTSVSSGDWTEKTNWIEGIFPNQVQATHYPGELSNEYDVIIRNSTVTFTSSGTVGVSKITLNDSAGQLDVNEGTLIASTTEADGWIQVASGARFNAGALTMNSGTLFIWGTGRLEVSSTSIEATIAGNGTIQGALDCSNNLDPIGTLTVTGGLTLHNSIAPGNPGWKSVLAISIDNDSTSDLLSVGAVAVLAGRLDEIMLPNGAGSISLDQAFTILSAGSITGVFENVLNGGRLAALDNDFVPVGSFRVNYGTGSAYASNLVVLDNFQAVPEPASGLAMVSFGMLALARRRRAAR